MTRLISRAVQLFSRGSGRQTRENAIFQAARGVESVTSGMLGSVLSGSHTLPTRSHDGPTHAASPVQSQAPCDAVRGTQHMSATRYVSVGRHGRYGLVQDCREVAAA